MIKHLITKWRDWKFERASTEVASHVSRLTALAETNDMFGDYPGDAEAAVVCQLVYTETFEAFERVCEALAADGLTAEEVPSVLSLAINWTDANIDDVIEYLDEEKHWANYSGTSKLS